jgi:hypothetical protein
MSMPIEKRPDAYKQCPSPSKCHDIYPSTILERLHPWRTSTGQDWLTHDPNGKLVILSSDGVLYMMDDATKGRIPEGAMGDFTESDITAFKVNLDEALSLVDSSKINFIYTAWSLGNLKKGIDDGLLDKWLATVKPYIDAGKVQWKTIPEIYDLYTAWEKS